MTPIDAVSRTYLIAALRLGQEIEGFVDSYHGPEELRETARSTTVEQALAGFQELLAGMEPSIRHTYLEAQARALNMAARIAAGEAIDFREQVSESFDIEPQWTDDSFFEAAHAMLDRLLPGSGTLAARRQRHRTRFEMPADGVLSLAQDLLADLRTRTADMVDLPQGETVDVRLVSDQPWAGYNWYLGNLTSRIEINTDLPVRLNDLPDLLAHEAYPGHHAEQVLHESLHLRRHGYGEAAITLVTSPQAVVSEGIATAAFDTVVPVDEQAAWLRSNVYEPAGINVDVESDLAIRQAGEALSAVSGNAALLLHEQDRPVDAVVGYIMQFGLRTEDEARKSIQFLTHPLFRTYAYTYQYGHELVTNYLLSRGDRHAGFHSLLTEQWTPSRLRGADRRRSSDDERLPL